ncbi:hypothetical protein EZ428_14285 [Pedobacter frigiditerrae]|uniref:Uncharacterized protein n=1 Tax=Pedobacter frigiditerrae TaxID=2530452 RepID=A0A4R0MTM7_9SPHI|nr:hypothetical protein [Pedobacter frigiditerrae]TCC90439.1 hypothetical protein EZ428_14285 [Pedobacter frigiditerrae]
MGLNPFWQEDVFLTVQGIYHQAQIRCVEPYFIIGFGQKLLIHLIPVSNNFNPEELIELQKRYEEENLLLVQLWEDVWLTKRTQVLSRINSFLGLNKGYHGRKAKIVTLNLKQASTFLNDNHLQGYIKAKYHYGLMDNDKLIAIASFSEARPMKSKGENYHSAELVRFASIDGLTIVGGLSKLIKHFLKQVKVNDLMSYADRDWSLGKGYDKLGFQLNQITAPAFIYINIESLTRYFPHRLPKVILGKFEAQNVLNLDEFLALNGYFKLFNTGNLKYNLYL